MIVKLLSQLTFLLLLTGCCWRGRDDTTTSIPQEFKRTISYQEQQNVDFLTSSGDTLHTIIYNVQETARESCAECYCASRSKEYETVRIVQGDSILAYISLIADQPYLTFDLKGEFFELVLDSSGSILCDSTLPTPVRCLDSLVVQGTLYKDVYQLEGANGSTSKRIFYQVNKGLLRVEQGNGDTWEVLE